MSARFENKVAIVTGAASGIGKACMIRLASEGATVIGFDNNRPLLEKTVALVEGTAVAMDCDVSDAKAVEQAVASTVDRFGAIHVLVNNAGIASRVRGPLHEMELEEWRRVLAVNVDGVFLMQRAAIRHMLAQGGGSIVNIGSTGSFRAASMSTAYLTSKGAVLMMTRSAAFDYAKDNIRVNCVCPGTTNTEILANSSPEFIEMLVSRSPQRRLGEPEEVAALVAFLASDEAPHITGGAYIIDGGRCAG